MMRIRVLTLFPDMIRSVVQTSILGRAIDSGLLEIESVNIRDFAGNRYGKVDDTLFGGGTGMLMMCQPVYDAWRHAKSSLGDPSRTVHLSPQGPVFTQQKAMEWSGGGSLILLCGHYEGIDQRVLDEIVDDEISVGDYVLTGGELPALIVIDAVARMIPGVLPSEEAFMHESHMDGFLEGPHYTKPAIWHEKKVPDVLLSGHHAKIEKYRKMCSLWSTQRNRPDLFDASALSVEEWKELETFIRSETEGDTYEQKE